MRILGVLVLVVGCGDSGGAPGGPSDGSVDALSDAPTIDAAHMPDGLTADALPGACDPVVQDCPGAARCTLNHDQPISHTFCDSTAGTVADFGTCMLTQSSDNCVAGSVCLATVGTALTCRRFCNTDTDCGANVCALVIGGTSGPLHACAQSCSVLQQNCQTTGEACYYGLNSSNQGKQECIAAGTKTAGQACNIANDCTPGLLCLQITGTNGPACTPTCDTSSPNCATGTCHLLVGQGTLGYCH